MVSQFNVATLFKINLLPQGGSAADRMTRAELEKAKQACQIEKTELEIDNLQYMVERENAYIESFSNEIGP